MKYPKYTVQTATGQQLGEFTPGPAPCNFFGKVAIDIHNPQKKIVAGSLTATLVEDKLPNEDLELENRRQLANVENPY